MLLARARRWESVLARSMGGGSREGWKEPASRRRPSFFFTGQVVVFLVAGALGAPLPRLPGRILGGVIGRLEGRRGPGELHAKVVVGGLTLVVEIRI